MWEIEKFKPKGEKKVVLVALRKLRKRERNKDFSHEPLRVCFVGSQ
jgi:hypothetical protein